MTRCQKYPPRLLTDQERHDLDRLSCARAGPAAVVTRAKVLLAVAGGQRFTDAARSAARRSGDAVGQLVARFNQHGLAALESGHGDGIMPLFTPPGGSWLTMCESVQRLLKRRALDGTHPKTPEEIIA